MLGEDTFVEEVTKPRNDVSTTHRGTDSVAVTAARRVDGSRLEPTAR
jgi:hypothetical protein